MKVLDRYLTRELFIPVFYSSLSLIFLILIADIFNNLDALLMHKTSPAMILKYYLFLVPYAFAQTISWAAWLGTLFLLVNLGFHNETIAMKAAGLKITSIMKPVIFLGFLFGISAFLVSDHLVPPTYRAALEIKDLYIEKERNKNKHPDKVMKNVTYYSGGQQLYFFRTFSKAKGEVNGAVGLWFEGENSRQKMMAQKGRWQDGVWRFEGVTEYQMDSQGRILGEPRTFPVKAYPELKFTPKELAMASMESAFLTYRELKSSIQKLQENGVNVYSERVDLNYRLAQPWQALVMMLLAIPFLARNANRKVIAMNVLICVGVIFAYHVTDAIGLALGKAGKIPPFLGAWCGNILFALGAVFNIEKGNY